MVMYETFQEMKAQVSVLTTQEDRIDASNISNERDRRALFGRLQAKVRREVGSIADSQPYRIAIGSWIKDHR